MLKLGDNVRNSLYTVVMNAPIVSSYDYGEFKHQLFGDIWSRLIFSVILAAIVAAVGETVLRFIRNLRRH